MTVFGRLSPETGIDVSNLPSNANLFRKTRFSMLTAEVMQILQSNDWLNVIVGIEVRFHPSFRSRPG